MVLRYSGFCFLKTLLQSEMTSAIAVLNPDPHIPWRDTFDLRCGVDALTGDPKYSALKKSTVRGKSLNDGSKKDVLMVEIIHGVHQQSRKHKFEVQGTVNPGLMSPSALGVSFAIQTSHLSSNHSFLVETIVSGEYDFETLDLDDIRNPVCFFFWLVRARTSSIERKSCESCKS